MNGERSSPPVGGASFEKRAKKKFPVTGTVKLELLLSTDHQSQIITYQPYVSQANAMHN